ncbi:PHD finger protein At3g20280-like isoform X2 [Panicum virgatum]|uniref:PHD finger protein At3g20280-like isoform X2 n=1 Tax=Panicum virgatum TaxID=38727 RepID=UPI0019D6754A|nr:PHD finger protein At3g20280-like isoform X2 [Panicum virgatum]
MGDAAAAAPATSPAGKRRRGDEVAGLRRVAEIVMVLAAAGEVRGGREPTAAERALAAEARERLAAAVAEGAVRPKDLFPAEAVRAVVEDLGLNRAKDPAAMGFRPPKASIADRLMLTKRKMEEVKEAPVQPTVSATQTVVSGMSEFHSLNGASKFGVGVPRNPQVVAVAATAPLTSTSPVILKPPGSSPVKPVANSSATVVHPNKSTLDTSARPNVNAVQSSNPLLKNQDTKPVAVQAATGNSVVGHHATQGVAFIPPKPTFVNHNEIAKSVQQFLHQPTNHPSWTPPSTEYMHSRLSCQICKVAITDTDSLLVCDACERGVHLKCLQQYGNKGVPKAEWHCSACLTQSKGKPLPPKYGKVTRTVVASKAAPPGSGAQVSLQGSAENMAAKENHQKLAANGNLMKPISTQGGSTIHNINVLALGAMAAGSQSQLASTLRPPIVNTVKAETSSNGKEGTGQQGSSMTQPDVKSPLRLRSGSSLNSAGSANDTMNSEPTAEMSGAEAKIKSEANFEPPVSRDEELVDSSRTSVEQTKIVATEEKPRAQATPMTDKVKDEETTTNTGTSTDQGRNFATGEKLPIEATSEALTINDVKMTINTGIPVQQSNIVTIEEKLQIDPASDPHRIQDMEMSTDNGPPADQSSNIVAEDMSQSEKTSSIGDTDVPANAGIPTDQTQHSNGSTENAVKQPPNGEPYKDKLGCNIVSDCVSTQKIASNGIIYPKDETSCTSENEAVGCNTEAKEAN